MPIPCILRIRGIILFLNRTLKIFFFLLLGSVANLNTGLLMVSLEKLHIGKMRERKTKRIRRVDLGNFLCIFETNVR